MYAGDFALGSTLDIKFTTRRFSSGAPFTLAGTPVISAYPDNSTTQLTAGITLSVDFDSVTGLHNIRVVATSGNGYAAGSSYALVITTGTVDSVSVVGEVVGSFTLERGAAFGRLGAPAGASVSADIAAVKTQTAAIETDTAEIGAAGAGLTAINLPDQTMSITGNITGNLSGSVGSVTGSVGSVVGDVGGNVVGTVDSVVGDVGGNVTGSVGSLAAQAKADVNAEVVDALNVDTYAEPGQGAPAATTTLTTKIGFLYKAWRNRHTQDGSEYALYNDDAVTKGQEAAVSDDNTTFERGEVGTGA